MTCRYVELSSRSIERINLHLTVGFLKKYPKYCEYKFFAQLVGY
jgi:hypothetical protein